MKIFLVLLFLLASSPVLADGHGEVHDLTELALLPDYCKGTDQIRLVSNDSKPMAEYIAIYGEAFRSLHHYCWALNSENKLAKISDTTERQSEMRYILGNIQYVLERAPYTFSLLPEIYISKARILFKMKRDVEAVGVLFELTRLRPEYSQAYAQLGDYYLRIGDKDNAIRTYEQGYLNGSAANMNFFIKKIRKLDKKYQPPARPVKPAEPAPETPPDSTPAQQAQPASEPSGDPQHPYCRFCP